MCVELEYSYCPYGSMWAHIGPMGPWARWLVGRAIRPHRQKELFKKVRIPKMDSQKGETPQRERTFRKTQDPENGFTRRGDPADRRSLYV